MLVLHLELGAWRAGPKLRHITGFAKLAWPWPGRQAREAMTKPWFNVLSSSSSITVQYAVTMTAA